MRHLAVVAGLCALLLSGAVQAQGRMTVREFLATADDIPRNPTALLRADTRRLLAEVRSGMAAVRTEQTAARAAGTRPASCPPEEVRLSPDAILGRFRAIPAARRNITVTQAMREWMSERYPCA